MRGGGVLLMMLVTILQIPIFTAHYSYSLHCEIQLHQRLSSSTPSLVSGGSSKAHHPSTCTTTNNDIVASEASSYKHSDIFCLTYSCLCDGSRPVQLGTCLHKTSADSMTLTCQCCSQEKAACRDTAQFVPGSSLGSSTLMAALRHRTSKIPNSHAPLNNENADESKAPVPPSVTAFLTVTGTIVLSCLVLFSVVCRLKICKSNEDTTSQSAGSPFIHAGQFVFPAYVKLPQACKDKMKLAREAGRCSGGGTKTETEQHRQQQKHSPVARSRSQSYNGGELAKDPIREDEEEGAEQ